MVNRTLRDAAGNLVAFYDDLTWEQVLPVRPCAFHDDFLGAVAAVPAAGSAVAGYPWVKKIQLTAGVPTVARVASQIGGVVACALDATSEKQEATLYFGDELEFDLTKGAVFDARAALSVLPSATGVEAFWGLMSTWIDGPNSNTYYVRFAATASGEVFCQSYDGTTTFSVDSGVALVAGAFHQFRIDATNPTGEIGFFIDGAKVSPLLGAGKTPITFAAGPPHSTLQPMLGVYKASGTGVATLQADVVRVWQTR
ncbi:MAG TPA: hypothetical protein VNE67_08965 [Acetobacteraceae bacterium]|nr:hypothetical protein [Acetobacteraceae bacterium]